jgi:hypothetical protein
VTERDHGPRMIHSLVDLFGPSCWDGPEEHDNILRFSWHIRIGFGLFPVFLEPGQAESLQHSDPQSSEWHLDSVMMMARSRVFLKCSRASSIPQRLLQTLELSRPERTLFSSAPLLSLLPLVSLCMDIGRKRSKTRWIIYTRSELQQ